MIRRPVTDTQELAVPGVSWATARYSDARNDLLSSRSRVQIALGSLTKSLARPLRLVDNTQHAEGTYKP